MRALATMLKVLWAIDALIFVVVLWEALTSKSDAAGRGMAGAFAVLAGLPLFLSLGIRLVGTSTPVVAASAAAAAVPLLVLGYFAVQPMLDRRRAAEQALGQELYEDPTMKEMALAIARSDTARMRALVAGGLDPNGFDEFQRQTFLNFALGHSPLAVRTLIELGADPNFAPERYLTPVAMAVSTAPHQLGPLLAMGGDPNAMGSGRAPILFDAIETAERGAFAALLAAGADPKATNSQGYTTLMTAIYHWRPDMAVQLLERGVDPRHVAPDGETAASLLAPYLGAPSDGENPHLQALLKGLAARGIAVEKAVAKAPTP